ncbi:MAG: hypothetical protein P3T54_07025 [Dehalogenimonas sp.]|jgi:fatty acid desaturase|uniref:Uncharacterized protein n=1 Tax=Candidatus Dehalogenimonas loeffleri TaxID=3127115 RepID=A0ABZ2J3A2_9CHLR|nr:hypothetical protein [Dehalogenimonas sp.]
MEQQQYYKKQDSSFSIAAAVDARDQGVSMMIGAAMVFGLAAGGLAIGYVSPFIQWLVTGTLGVLGTLLTVSGIVKVLSGR